MQYKLSDRKDTGRHLVMSSSLGLIAIKSLRRHDIVSVGLIGRFTSYKTYFAVD